MPKEKQERPVVQINAHTANTIGIKIITNNGEAWIVAGDHGISVTSDGIEIEVKS